MKDNGDFKGSTSEMAQVLCNHYECFYTLRTEKTVLNTTDFFEATTHTKPDRQGQLSDITITEDNIITAIKNITPNSSVGPDGFHALLLKNCKHQLAKPLKILWTKSLEAGNIPEALKDGIKTPVYKGGSKDLPKSYRPITLTSDFIKVFENGPSENYRIP